ncbi:MAG: hypothetical protein Q8M35_01170 [Pseudohongiella sp.]|nr:hypothetical protein [Pseudohongiella sp.]
MVINIGTAVYPMAELRAFLTMNEPHCLVCALIKSRAELLQKALLISKYRQFKQPAKTINTLAELRAQQTYTLAACCVVNQKRLIQSEQALELEIARLKLRAEHISFQQEQLNDQSLAITRLA